jgi:predicted nucleic acid-binding protein
MLDTNVISELIRDPQGKAAKRIERVGETNICTSIIVAAELRYGCAKKVSNACSRQLRTSSAKLKCCHSKFPPTPNMGHSDRN